MNIVLMKKICRLLITSVIVLFSLFCLIGEVYGLINDTRNAIIGLCGTGTIGFAVSLNNKLIKKKQIDWDSYPELENIVGWICFSSWAFLFEAIHAVIVPITISTSTHNPIYSEAIVFLFLSIYSFWTYFSLLLGKGYSLWLLRSFLLCFISLFLFTIVGLPQKTIEIHFESLFNDFDWIWMCIIIFGCMSMALVVKGFLLTFKTHIKNRFKDFSLSYIQIVIIVLLWLCILLMRNTNLTVPSAINPNYPALKSTK